MQFRYVGRNNKGEALVIREVDETSLDFLHEVLSADMRQHAGVISFEICIARPDPEVVKLKLDIHETLREMYQYGTERQAEMLLNRFDIKLKGKDNA